VVAATVDLDQVRSFRGSIISRGMQAASYAGTPYPRLPVDMSFTKASANMATGRLFPSLDVDITFHSSEEEIRFLKSFILTSVWAQRAGYGIIFVDAKPKDSFWP
jgi:hypothetical protein